MLIAALLMASADAFVTWDQLLPTWPEKHDPHHDNYPGPRLSGLVYSAQNAATRKRPLSACASSLAPESGGPFTAAPIDRGTRASWFKGDVFLDAAMNGEFVKHEGATRVKHTNCYCKLPSGKPCYTNLWADKDQIRAHMELLWNAPQEPRSAMVFSELQHMWFSDVDADGQSTRGESWHFFVHGRRVCREVFRIAYPIGETTVSNLQARVKEGREYAHAKKEEGGGGATLGRARLDSGRLGVIGWYLAYADAVGDYMPHEQKTIVPRRFRAEEFSEYQSAVGDDAVRVEYFCDILRSADELADISRARKLLIFQKCTTCVDLDEKVSKALKSHRKDLIAEVKALRASHHAEQRAERLAYYKRAEQGRSGESCLSFILDKWDSAKTTVPFFARHPGAWWSDVKHNVLEMHVLGILVHGTPNEIYLYPFNETIKGDANSNIEGIRRMLVHKFANQPMPQRLNVQADNASDNKCWAVILFFGMLVHHGYTNEVFFSFLLVGHTHEDIDQIFSILSKAFKNAKSVMTPREFEEFIRETLRDRPHVYETMHSVVDWTTHLKPCLRKGIVGIQHATVETPDGKEELVPHTFWIHRGPSGDVAIHYKEKSADPIWLPSLDPDATAKVTNPEGIKLFKADRPPPDPMTTSPVELELRSVAQM